MNARRYVLSLLVLWVGCGGDDEEKARTPAEFCAEWAEAACSPETVSACQAADAATCRKSQALACIRLVPESYSDEMGDACIAAVKAAYADGDLRGEELATVGRLSGPCASIIRGPKAKGESCSSTTECQASGGLTCVRKSDSAKGTCQVAEEVAGGRDCEAAQKTCAAGFYCDGENCLEAKDVGESCKIPEECGPDRFCSDDGECEAGRKTGAECTADDQCNTGICLDYEGKMVCTDRIVLTRSEPACNDLR